MKKINAFRQVGCLLLLAMTSFFFYSCSDSVSSESYFQFNYLAVQLEKGDNWSIVDADGKVVVKEEYPASNTVFRVNENGVYWVLDNEKYSLYSVKSPKRPLTSVEYDAVTNFYDGRALVSVYGEPIKVINEDGKVVNILPNDIIFASQYSGGLSAFKNKQNLWGALDTDGKIKINAEFDGVGDFNGGVAIALKDSTNYVIIDDRGKITGTIKKERYKPYGIFSEGMITAFDLDNNYLVYLDKKAEVAVRPSKELTYYFGYRSEFHEGTVEVFNTDNEVGLMDNNGEMLIRMGKYLGICYIGDGQYCATKSNKETGIIDKDENVIVPFDYTAMVGILGDNYVMEQGSYWVLVDKNGKEVKNIEFANVYADRVNNTYVKFDDIKSKARAIADQFTPTGFKDLQGKKSVAEIAEYLKVDIEGYSAYDVSFEYNLNIEGVNTPVRVIFDTNAKKESYRTEVQSDGWSSNEIEVFDGYVWNPDAQLERVAIDFDASEIKDLAAFRKMIEDGIRSNGFKEVDGVLTAQNGKDTLCINIWENYHNIVVSIYKKIEYQEEAYEEY